MEGRLKTRCKPLIPKSKIAYVIMTTDPIAIADILGGVLQPILRKYDAISKAEALKNVTLTSH